MCTLTDITERKQLEKERFDALLRVEGEQRRRAMDAEENKLKQTQFVDMICHEIRYPNYFFKIENKYYVINLTVKKKSS